MQTFIQRNAQFTGVTMGIIGALVLLALTSRPSAAEKAQPGDCDSGLASMCRMVETCTPKGFEANGTCKWIYTASKYYWR